MESEAPFTAKALTRENASDAIVVSFGAEWKHALEKGQIKGVIRKRVPKTSRPRWLYAHINAPVSAIYVRAEIRNILQMPLKEAILKASALHMKAEDIVTYVGRSSDIGYYDLRNLCIASSPLTLSRLATYMVYYPPQSFFVLSKDAKALLDQHARFKKLSTRRS